eukprot:12899614-Prorocentrum_lima.AAC.1
MGFVPGRRAQEMHGLLFLLVHRSWSYGLPLVVAKLDITKAYDSVHWPPLLQLVLERGGEEAAHAVCGGWGRELRLCAPGLEP